MCCWFDAGCCSVHSGNLMLPLRAGGSKANCDASAAAWTDYGFVSHKVAAGLNGKDVSNPHKRWIAPEQQEILKRMRALKTGQPVNPFKRSPFSNGRESHLRSPQHPPPTSKYRIHLGSCFFSRSLVSPGPTSTARAACSLTNLTCLTSR
jgi:hypothetical protein